MGMGGSGGGSSGKVDYPDYMKAVHEDWLSQDGSDAIESSVTEIMSAALGSSPFASTTVYDPDTELGTAWTAVGAFNTVVDAMDSEVDWTSAIAAAVSEFDANVFESTQLDDEINAFKQTLDDQLDYIDIPKFEAGMRDANSVLSSAFAIGKAVIFGMHNRNIAKFSADLRTKVSVGRLEWVLKAAETMLSNQVSRVEFEKTVAALSVEAKRIHIVAKKEECDTQIKIDESDARWDLEVFQYGSNVLSSIGGGTASTAGGKMSPMASALGGALSGAALGAQVTGGNPYGAMIGGVLGLGMSLLGD